MGNSLKISYSAKPTFLTQKILRICRYTHFLPNLSLDSWQLIQLIYITLFNRSVLRISDSCFHDSLRSALFYMTPIFFQFLIEISNFLFTLVEMAKKSIRLFKLKIFYFFLFFSFHYILFLFFQQYHLFKSRSFDNKNFGITSFAQSNNLTNFNMSYIMFWFIFYESKWVF